MLNSFAGFPVSVHCVSLQPVFKQCASRQAHYRKNIFKIARGNKLMPHVFFSETVIYYYDDIYKHPGKLLHRVEINFPQSLLN
jgi:hypothetical protein